MEKKFIDPNIINKSKTVEEKISIYNHEGSKLPLPTEIEISETGTCNRTCSFCPRVHQTLLIKEFISNLLHEKLCRELQEIEYKEQLDIVVLLNLLLIKIFLI